MELTADPKYQVRPEWTLCDDGVRRLQYRPYLDGKPIGTEALVSQQDAIDVAKRYAQIDNGLRHAG